MKLTGDITFVIAEEVIKNCRFFRIFQAKKLLADETLERPQKRHRRRKAVLPKLSGKYTEVMKADSNVVPL